MGEYADLARRLLGTPHGEVRLLSDAAPARAVTEAGE